MKQLLILSGKGGTGKTTTAAAFIDFSQAKTFADCDVDAPNLHLVTSVDAEPVKKPYFGSQKAQIDSEKCIGCGVCQNYCRFGAIHHENGTYFIDPMACEGCGLCIELCHDHAVHMADDIAGELKMYEGDRVFSTAQLKMGRGNSGKLVTEVKKEMNQKAKPCDLAIIDGSPGIGCPVIASISGVDMVLIVTEPSFSGISDLKRILKTCSFFRTKAAVCINRYDISPENTRIIEQFCQEQNIPVAGKVPFDQNASKAINEGISIARINCPARDALKQVYDKSISLLI